MITDRLQKSTPTWKNAVASTATTIAIWTPRSSAQIVLTGLAISAGGTTTTVHVFFSKSTTTAGKKVGMFSVNTTAFINPLFNGLPGGQDVPLNIMSNTAAVDVTAYGFELAE
jgi:hypothetical protein